MDYLFIFCTHYALRGGNSYDGSVCGAFYVYLDVGAGNAVWRRGAHYAVRGGASGYGLICGSFCVSVSYNASIAYWSHGAALSSL